MKGAYVSHLTRLVAVVVGVGALVMTYMSVPDALDICSIDRKHADQIVVLTILPALFSAIGGVFGIVVERTASDGSSKPSSPQQRRLRAADSFTVCSLRLFVVTYFGAMVLSAALPIVRTASADSISPHTQPLVSLYFVATAATIVFPVRLRFLYLVGLTPLILLILAAPANSVKFVVFEEVLVSLTTSLSTLSALSYVIRQGEALDVSFIERQDGANALALKRAEDVAKRHSNRLIHDHVLSVLIAVASGVEDSESLRQTARAALTGVTEVTFRDQDSGGSSDVLLLRLADYLNSVCEDLSVSISVTEKLMVPNRVWQSLFTASGEVVRNSLRHADSIDGAHSVRGPRRIKRWARLISSDVGVYVEICDNGVGFDPAAVRKFRYGLDESVIAAMEESGGEVSIVSSAGQGTKVHLKWSPQNETTGCRYGVADVNLEKSKTTSWEGRLSDSVHTLGARGIAAVMAVLYIILVAGECVSGSYFHTAPVFLSLIALFVAAALLLKSWPEGDLPFWAASVVVMIAAGGNLMVLRQIASDGWPGYAGWSTGVSVILCCVLVLRGCGRGAWLGVSLITITVLYWIISTGRPIAMLSTYMASHWVLLLAWQAIAYLSARAANEISTNRRVTTEITAYRLEQVRVNELMNRRMVSVRQRVSPLLSRIATGAPLTAQMRISAGILEAEIRDEIRAPFFSGTCVVACVSEARQRGVDVVLLDDSCGNRHISPDLKRCMLEYVALVLDCTTAGRAVVRVHPPHRSEYISVVTDFATHEIDYEGRVVYKTI
jgi:hypothetical protein